LQRLSALESLDPVYGGFSATSRLDRRGTGRPDGDVGLQATAADVVGSEHELRSLVAEVLEEVGHPEIISVYEIAIGCTARSRVGEGEDREAEHEAERAPLVVRCSLGIVAIGVVFDLSERKLDADEALVAANASSTIVSTTSKATIEPCSISSKPARTASRICPTYQTDLLRQWVGVSALCGAREG